MGNWLAVFGAVVVVLVLVLAIVWAWGYALYCRARIDEKKQAAVKAATLREIGGDLQACAHWFSEDEKSMLAVRAVGDELCSTGYLDAKKVRDRWRRTCGGTPG